MNRAGCALPGAKKPRRTASTGTGMDAAPTDLVMGEHHGLVEDRPRHRLEAGRGGQGAVVAEIEVQAVGQQARDVEPGHQDFLIWEEKARE